MAFINYLEEHFTIKYVSGGRQVQVLGECPFCGASDKIYVNPKKEVGICFKCGDEGGFNAVKFVMAHADCEYEQAKRILEGGEDDWVRKDEVVDDLDGDWFPRVEPVAGRALQYLRDRGITNELIRHFGLCYCSTNTKVGDRVFYTRGRIIIPIFDASRRVVSWQGRAISKKAKIRYLFPISFKASEYLFNIHGVPQDPKYLIIAEGAFDVFGWWRAGFKNVVGTFGKKISEAQIDMVRIINPQVVFIAWDGDARYEKYKFVEDYGYCLPKVKIINLGLYDADELSTEQLIEAVKTSKSYNWEDKILGSI